MTFSDNVQPTGLSETVASPGKQLMFTGWGVTGRGEYCNLPIRKISH